MGGSLINQLIFAQEELLSISREIQLAQQLEAVVISTRIEEVRMHKILEANPKGDLSFRREEDKEEVFWSVIECQGCL